MINELLLLQEEWQNIEKLTNDYKMKFNLYNEKLTRICYVVAYCLWDAVNGPEKITLNTEKDTVHSENALI